ncbi:MAG TPA: hypothetical protein VG929_09680 [Actinomycetota bacterium]|nr:hypothetical protein [Actinomycetota bacterium]
MTPILRSPAIVRLAIVCLTMSIIGAFSGRDSAPVEAAAAGLGEGLNLVAEFAMDTATHMETATIKGRDYAFVSEIGGSGKLHVIDITVPERAREISVLPCNGSQGNVQLSHDKQTLVIGMDVSILGCAGVDARGFVTVDISDLENPRVIGYAENPRGSHSIAVHPRKPYVYNGEGFPKAPGRMQVWSIKNPARPKLVTVLDTGAHSPHDLAFNRDGSLMATANAINVHLMDTSDPTDPKIVHTTQCPGCLHTHEARFSPDSKRLVVNDEYPASACPGGAIYFYDVTKAGSDYGLALTGTYTVDDVGLNANADATTKCTPHIFDISSDGTKMAASWHEGGVRYLDISSPTGITVGAQQTAGQGIQQLGYYVSKGGYAFSAKLHKGPYVYVVDTNIGFQVFKVASSGRS